MSFICQAAADWAFVRAIGTNFENIGSWLGSEEDRAFKATVFATGGNVILLSRLDTLAERGSWVARQLPVRYSRSAAELIAKAPWVRGGADRLIQGLMWFGVAAGLYSVVRGVALGTLGLDTGRKDLVERGLEETRLGAGDALTAGLIIFLARGLKHLVPGNRLVDGISFVATVVCMLDDPYWILKGSQAMKKLAA